MSQSQDKNSKTTLDCQHKHVDRIKDRRKLLNFYKRNRSNELIKSKIKGLTKEIRKDIRTAKANKWDKIVKDKEEEPRDTKRGWNKIKRILKNKQTHS